jgi:hypothetical protein
MQCSRQTFPNVVYIHAGVALNTNGLPSIGNGGLQYLADALPSNMAGIAGGRYSDERSFIVHIFCLFPYFSTFQFASRQDRLRPKPGTKCLRPRLLPAIGTLFDFSGLKTAIFE